MKIGQYCQRQRCRHVELEQFWQAFASHGFVSDSWAFLLPHDAIQSVVGLLLRQVVHLSITLRYRDHIGWNTLKIISRLVSVGCSLFTDLNITNLLQGEYPEILARIGGIEKAAFAAYKSCNISEMRQDRTKVAIEVQ